MVEVDWRWDNYWLYSLKSVLVEVLQKVQQVQFSSTFDNLVI